MSTLLSFIHFSGGPRFVLRLSSQTVIDKSFEYFLQRSNYDSTVNVVEIPLLFYKIAQYITVAGYTIHTSKYALDVLYAKLFARISLTDFSNKLQLKTHRKLPQHC